MYLQFMYFGHTNADAFWKMQLLCYLVCISANSCTLVQYEDSCML
jgi:hypothetical protein